MSNDAMPCGCEGHADNSDLCRYPALESSLRQAEQEVASYRHFMPQLEVRLRQAEADRKALLALCQKALGALSPLFGTMPDVSGAVLLLNCAVAEHSPSTAYRAQVLEEAWECISALPPEARTMANICATLEALKGKL